MQGKVYSGKRKVSSNNGTAKQVGNLVNQHKKLKFNDNEEQNSIKNDIEDMTKNIQLNIIKERIIKKIMKKF